MIGGLRRAAAEWAIALLSDEPRQFAAMQGSPIDVDLFRLPGFRPPQRSAAEGEGRTGA